MQRFATVLCAAIVVLLPSVFARHAVAQSSDYPSRAIKLIVPYAPGGPDDVIARIVGNKLSKLLGQPVVVENHPGVGGTIAMGVTAKSPPDGYTLAIGDTGQLAIAPALYAKLEYDPLRDLAPVANVALLPYVLAVNPQVPATTVKELVELAKAKKPSMTYGSTGTGGSANLASELFKSIAGVDFLQVPYKGAAPYVTALISGEIDMAITDLAMVRGHAKAGKIRLLATTSSKRPKAAPQLPTMEEAGIEGYAVDIWVGIVAPGGTPAPIINKLSSAIATALSSPDVQQRFDDIGYTTVGNTPAQFSATIRNDIEKYGRIIKTTNIPQQ